VTSCLNREELLMLAKVFLVSLNRATQAEADAAVGEFVPRESAPGPGTRSFRVCRHPVKPGHLLFAMNFMDQAGCDAHAGSAACKELIAGQLTSSDHGVRPDRPRAGGQRLMDGRKCL
jgi:hypothetical protein